MKRIAVVLAVVGLCAVSGPGSAHDEEASVRLEERIARLENEVSGLSPTNPLRDLARWQPTRNAESIRELGGRVLLIERYMHWFVPEFTNEWERRFPEKVKNMKEAGGWPDDEDLYGRRFNQLERIVLDEWVRLRDADLAAYANELHKRISALEEWARRQ